MDKAKRRRTAEAQLNQAVKLAHAEGQGVWQLACHHRNLIPEIIAAGLAGDREGELLCEAILDVIKGVSEAASANSPIKCLTCENEMTPQRMPEAFLTVRGSNPHAKNLLVFLACDDCYFKPNHKQLVFAKLKSDLLHDARMIHPMEPGHA